jgi:hypothetical protein
MHTVWDAGSAPLPCPEWFEDDFNGDVIFDLQPIYRNASFLITKATMTFILLDSTHHIPIGTSNSCTADVGTAAEAPSVTLAINNKLFPVGDSLGMSFLGKLENNHKFTVELDLTTVRRWATSPATNFGLAFVGGPAPYHADSECVSYYNQFTLDVDYTVYT